jgi:hypothetical protein
MELRTGSTLPLMRFGALYLSRLARLRRKLAPFKPHLAAPLLPNDGACPRL